MKEENLKSKNMYFTGIAGAGMSALSQIAAMEGHEVSGSDRNFDNNRSFSLRDKLEKLSIKIFPQDGSGISKNTDILIVSTAVENENPDILKVFTDHTALRRHGKPEEISALAVYLASAESSFMTGQTLCVDGGYTIA